MGTNSDEKLLENEPVKNGHPDFAPGNKVAQKHGLNPLKKAVYTLGNRAIDRRTSAGRALAEWRESLIRDLGGDVSTQQDCIIWLAVKTKLLLDSIDAWLVKQDSLIFENRRAVIPAVAQRQQLADALARYMAQLGLKRVPRELVGLDLARRLQYEQQQKGKP
jgi:hypothetical protein